MACLKGFEPLTFWFVAKHSIRLSYRHTLAVTLIYYSAARGVCQEALSLVMG